MNHFRFLCLCILPVCTAAVLYANPDTILVLQPGSSAAGYWRLQGPEIEIYEDSRNTLDFEAVFRDHRSDFTPLTQACCNFGYERHTVWLRFKIENQMPGEQFLIELVNPFITKLTMVQADEQGRVLRTDTTGTSFPFWHRPETGRNFLFPVEVQKGERRWIYVALAPDYPLYLRILCWERNERLGAQQRLEDILLTIFFVFCGLYLFLSAMLIIVAKQHYLWWYFWYVLVTSLFIPAHLGLAFRYVWPGHPYWQFVVPAVFNILHVVFGIQFFRKYINLPDISKRFNTFITVSIGIFLLTALLIAVHQVFPRQFIGWVLNSFFAYLVLFSLAALGWIAKRIFFNRWRRASWLFLIATVHLAGLITTSLQYLGYGSLDFLWMARWFPDLERLSTLFVAPVLMGGFFMEMILVFYFSSQRYIRISERNQVVQSMLAKAKEDNLNALILGAENERQRIARELHDGACVNLAALRMQLNTLRENGIDPVLAKKLAGIAAEIELTYREVRGISHNLMSKALEKKDLLTALEDLCLHIEQAQPGLSVQLFAQCNLSIINNLAKIHLYRIIQEILGNVLKHAQASAVQVQLVETGQVLQITVEDDGQGFVTGKAASGIGLSNIRSRVSLLRGTFHLDSAPGQGTYIRIDIPVAAIHLQAPVS